MDVINSSFINSLTQITGIKAEESSHRLQDSTTQDDQLKSESGRSWKSD